jgi:predicted ArsR family transcriptional regulator
MMEMHERESRHPRRTPRPRQADSRSVLLDALRAAGRPLTVGEAAEAIGTAESTARFHLSLLVSAGLVEKTPVRSGSAGRPSWLYGLVPVAPASPASAVSPTPYQELARVLAAQLDGEAGAAAAAREAGRRWADAVPPAALAPAASPPEALESLAGMLDGLGFAPDAPAGDEIVLRACPFEAVAREHRAVVCSVHLGLVERAANAIGGGIEVAGLEPFRSERPLACAVQLRRNA